VAIELVLFYASTDCEYSQLFRARNTPTKEFVAGKNFKINKSVDDGSYLFLLIIQKLREQKHA
jgi:hypothetical protein